MLHQFFPDNSEGGVRLRPIGGDDRHVRPEGGGDTTASCVWPVGGDGR